MSIFYIDSVAAVKPAQLAGFFVGWPNPPSAATHLKILQNSDEVILALDSSTGQVVGFMNALSDGVLMAYLPLLEVLPEYQDRGIGTELIRRMLSRLEKLYAVDVVCDEDLVGFYERFNFKSGRGMMLRDYHNQSGKK
jgi:ribosomal protein S18 acetylase RimI-like enzyme